VRQPTKRSGPPPYPRARAPASEAVLQAVAAGTPGSLAVVTLPGLTAAIGGGGAGTGGLQVAGLQQPDGAVPQAADARGGTGEPPREWRSHIPATQCSTSRETILYVGNFVIYKDKLPKFWFPRFNGLLNWSARKPARVISPWGVKGPYPLPSPPGSSLRSLGLPPATGSLPITKCEAHGCDVSFFFYFSFCQVSIWFRCRPLGGGH